MKYRYFLGRDVRFVPIKVGATELTYRYKKKIPFSWDKPQKGSDIQRWRIMQPSTSQRAPTMKHRSPATNSTI